MTENLKRFLTDASAISAIVVYSYIVYLFGELGYLNAYGITDVTSLVPLEVQSVIFGFIQGLIYFTIFIALLVAIMTPVVKRAGKKAKIRDSKALKRLFFVIVIAVDLILIPALKDREGLILAGFSFIFIIVFTYLVTFVKVHRTSTSLLDLLEIFFEKLTHQNDKPICLKRLLTLSLIVTVIFVPIVSYVINYDGVSISQYQNLKIVELNGSEYVLIRQYSDKNILVQIKDNTLLPNYIIQRGDQINKITYRLENKKIDNKLIFPKSTELIEISQYLRSLFVHK